MMILSVFPLALVIPSLVFLHRKDILAVPFIAAASVMACGVFAAILT